MLNYLLFKTLDKEVENWEQVFFYSRADILSSSFIQDKLKTHNKKLYTIKCLCNTKHDIYLNSRTLKNDKYSISTNPKQAALHNEECPLFNESNNLIDEEDNLYRTKIFDEVILTSTNSKKEEIEKAAKENSNRRSTFKNLCMDLLVNSYSYVFNKANYDRDRTNFINPTIQEFFSTFYRVLKNKTILKKGKNEFSIIDYTKEAALRFKYGVCTLNLKQLLEEHKEHNENFIIEIEMTCLTNNNEEYIQVIRVKNKILREAFKRVQIFDNYITGEYFLISVLDRYNNASRIFIYPMYANFLNGNFCFVESNLERVYAMSLFEENKTFIKPISNDEFMKIKKEKIILDSDSKKPYLINRPDFIEFDNSTIQITEVLGFQEDKDYMLHIEKKREEYEKLSSIYNFIKYKEVRF